MNGNYQLVCPLHSTVVALLFSIVHLSPMLVPSSHLHFIKGSKHFDNLHKRSRTAASLSLSVMVASHSTSTPQQQHKQALLVPTSQHDSRSLSKVKCAGLPVAIADGHGEMMMPQKKEQRSCFVLHPRCLCILDAIIIVKLPVCAHPVMLTPS